MIKNYFIIALRNIKRYYAHTILNLVGMAIGIASTVLISLWVQDEWSFVAATYDGSLLQLYVDGEMVNEKDVGTPDTGVNGTAQGAMWLGSWKAPGWDFTGVLDEAAVFSVPLSEEDILNIMDNGLEHVTAVSSPGKIAVTWGYVKDVK